MHVGFVPIELIRIGWVIPGPIIKVIIALPVDCPFKNVAVTFQPGWLSVNRTKEPETLI